MDVRTALLGLCCAAAVLVVGCSASIPGVPKGPNGGGPSGTGVAPFVTASSEAGDGDTGNGGDLGSSHAGDGGDLESSAADGGDSGGGGSEESPATCNALQNLWSGFTELQMDQNGVTQEQIDQLFQGTDQAAPEVQPDLKMLHDAAEQAASKSASDADAILNSDEVNSALLDLHLNAVQC